MEKKELNQKLILIIEFNNTGVPWIYENSTHTLSQISKKRMTNKIALSYNPVRKVGKILPLLHIILKILGKHQKLMM